MKPALAQIIVDLQIGDEFLWEPIRLARPGPWSGHIPFAFWLTKIVRPSLFVELGTHSGNSYSAFCQAISLLGLPARAFAVDTWQGDEYAGLYDESVFHDLVNFNETHYAGFSKLLCTTFDDARAYFSEGTIDLLHIDGKHSYEAVKHDFDNWTGALSDRAVVVFHDTNVHERDFGVWKMWLELAEAHPSFEFHHSEGLGVLGVGPNQPDVLRRLFELKDDPESASIVRRIFAAQGEVFRSRSKVLDLSDHCDRLLKEHTQALSSKDESLRSLELLIAGRDKEHTQALSSKDESLRSLELLIAGRDAALAERQHELQSTAELIAGLQRRLVEHEYSLRSKDDELQLALRAIHQKDQLLNHKDQLLLKKNHLLGSKQSEIAQANDTAAQLREQLTQSAKTLDEQRSAASLHIEHLSEELSSVTLQLGLIESSSAWKAVSRIRGAFQKYPKFRRFARRAARIIWWTITLQLFARLRDRRRLLQTRDLIAKSALFDASWYVSHNPDVAEAGYDPALHYALCGAAERRNPGPHFDAQAYLNRNPDVARAGANPLVHYLEHGKIEGRQINSLDEPADQPQPHESDKSVPPYHALAAKEQSKADYVARSSEFLDSRQLAVKAVAFYLPQFHPIPENDLWWGKNFTEWKNVAKATPRFVGHYQPHLPGEQGFYDLRVPEILAEQTDIAKQYGISAFCFHYYWFSGKRLLEKPLEQFLANPALDISFCICWANENWTRRWDGLEHDVLIAQEYSPSHDRELIESLLPAFRDPRCIRINGNPLFLVYRIDLLPDPVKTIARWRESAKTAGFHDLFVAAVLSFEIRDVMQYGADAAVEFPPHQTVPDRITGLLPLAPDLLKDGAAFDYAGVARRFGKSTSDGSLVFKCVMPGWDNTARRGSQSIVFHGSTPAVYAGWLKDACELTCLNPSDQRLLFINAWNEWGEGAHLESDARYGYAYLNATANVLRNYYHDPQVEDFIAQNNARFLKRSDVAIVLHCYYEDLGREIVDQYITCQSKAADVFVTVRPDVSVHFLEYLKQNLDNALLLREENRGRDVRPFLLALRRLRNSHYRYACKIHTKRSPHRQDGDEWRDFLISSLLDGPDAISLVEQRFSADENLGLLVPSGSLVDLSVEEINLGNRSWLDKLLPGIGCTHLIGSYRALFPAGSMYWFRLEALAGLENLVLDEDAFEPEVGQLDGTLAHAVERIILLYASAGGYRAEEFNSLDAHLELPAEFRR